MRGQSKRPLSGRAISERIHKTTLQPGRRLPPQPTTRKGEVILIESDDDESGDEPEMISELATPSRRTLLSRPTRPTSLRRADGPIVPQHKVSVSTLSRRVDDTRPPASSTRYLGQTREALPKKTGNSEGTSGRKPASGPAITATTTAKKSAWPPPEPFLSQPPHAFPLAVKARIYPATQRPGRQQKGNSGLKTLETFGFQPAASHLPKAATETTPRNSAFAAAALIPTHTTASTALPKLRPVPTPPKREAIQTHGSSSRSCQSLPRTPRHATAVSPRPSVSTTTPAAKPIKQEAGGQLPSSSSSRMARVALLPPRTPENKTSARRAPVVSASPTVGTYGDPYTISSDSDSDGDSDSDSGGGGDNKDSSRDEVREQRRRRSLFPSSPSKGFFAALYTDVAPRNADRIPSYLDTPSSGAELRSCTYRHPLPAVVVATTDNNTRFTARGDGGARLLTATTNTTTTTTANTTTRPWIRTLWPKREEKEDEDEEEREGKGKGEGEGEGKIGPFSAAERRGEQLFRRRVAPGGAREPDNPIPLSLPRPRPRLHPPLPPPPPPPPTPASRATTAAVDAVTPTPKPSNASLSSSSSLSRKTDDNKLTPAVMAMAPPAQIQRRTACPSTATLSDRNQHVKKEEEEEEEAEEEAEEEEEEGEGIAGSQQQQHADHRHQHRHHPTRMQSQDNDGGGGGEIQLPQPARPPKHKHEHKGKRDHDRESKRASRHRNRDRAGWRRQRRRRKREQQRREEESERERRGKAK
ncbi:hypothetical protein SAMD00023353_3100680 [Rosellinia necatrix]|uniref:Uncharacterized protein n=1 Tax=Rosellinia necatrix TaxID=77044 RepID=A0A1W2TTZ7_ROSNE|nr:hypothetical protein SAMD00023353_3100680 [Rosellinia necatrix]